MLGRVGEGRVGGGGWPWEGKKDLCFFNRVCETQVHCVFPRGRLVSLKTFSQVMLKNRIFYSFCIKNVSYFCSG